MSDSNRSNTTANTSGSNSTNNDSNANQGFTDTVRQTAADAYDSARGTASEATRRAEDAIDESPMIALAAGMAAGALVAALLPVTRSERQMIGPVGSRVTGAAREAAQTARRVAPGKLRELGLTPDAIAQKAKEAATDTAQAAGRKFRNEATNG